MKATTSQILDAISRIENQGLSSLVDDLVEVIAREQVASYEATCSAVNPVRRILQGQDPWPEVSSPVWGARFKKLINS